MCVKVQNKAAGHLSINYYTKKLCPSMCPSSLEQIPDCLAESEVPIFSKYICVL